MKRITIIIIALFLVHSLDAKSITNSDSFKKNKLNIAAYTGTSIGNLNSSYKVHEFGVQFRIQKSKKIQYYLDLGTHNFSIDKIAIQETQLLRDENNMLTGEYSEIIDTIDGFRGYSIGIGCIIPLRKNFHFVSGLDLFLNRTYYTSYSSNITYRRINNFANLSPSASISGDGTGYQIKESPYSKGQILSQYHAGLRIGFNYDYKKFHIGIISKIGITDITKNSFFNNGIFNSTQYLGLRLGLDLFTIEY